MSKYYIVINEWNYPTNSGREIISDYDTLKEARKVAKKEYLDEYDNFLDNTKGKIFREGCGLVFNLKDCVESYQLVSSPYDETPFFFRSVILERTF